MRCVEIQDILSGYADGHADQRGRRIAERHIQLCSACQRQVVAYSRLGLQLRRLSLMPPGIIERLPRLRQDVIRTLLRRKQLGRLFGSFGLLVIMLGAVTWMLALR